MTTTTYEEQSAQLEGTSGVAADNDVPERENSNDVGKVLRAGTPTSTFWHFANFRTHGAFRFTANIGADKVNSASQVAASITELTAGGTPFLGNAVMEVHNVVPHSDGRVIVRGHVHWESDLNVRLNYIIVN